MIKKGVIIETTIGEKKYIDTLDPTNIKYIAGKLEFVTRDESEKKLQKAKIKAEVNRLELQAVKIQQETEMTTLKIMEAYKKVMPVSMFHNAFISMFETVFNIFTRKTTEDIRHLRQKDIYKAKKHIKIMVSEITQEAQKELAKKSRNLI